MNYQDRALERPTELPLGLLTLRAPPLHWRQGPRAGGPPARETTIRSLSCGRAGAPKLAESLEMITSSQSAQPGIPGRETRGVPSYREAHPSKMRVDLGRRVEPPCYCEPRAGASPVRSVLMTSTRRISNRGSRNPYPNTQKYVLYHGKSKICLRKCIHARIPKPQGLEEHLKHTTFENRR